MTCDSLCVRSCEVWERVRYPRGMGVRNEDTRFRFIQLLASFVTLVSTLVLSEPLL